MFLPFEICAIRFPKDAKILTKSHGLNGYYRDPRAVEVCGFCTRVGTVYKALELFFSESPKSSIAVDTSLLKSSGYWQESWIESEDGGLIIGFARSNACCAHKVAHS
ncbi:uncharacterized protein [Prorops nasuta]|uniref:uncharacterized protein n=1 Tax=Prorops nasuta TaxID=863751 RepID=UPI0034CF1B23